MLAGDFDGQETRRLLDTRLTSSCAQAFDRCLGAAIEKQCSENTASGALLRFRRCVLWLPLGRCLCALR